MFEDRYPVRWAGRHAVVALPEHIDVANAGHIREELLSVINRGAEALIADMTTTISCDQAGADALVRAYRRAVVSGTDLRLVVTARIVSRTLSLSGVDRLVSIYPSLETAMAARTPAPVLTLVNRPGASGADGQAPPEPGSRARRQVAGAGVPAGPGGNGASITPAVVRKLVDALQDGVVLADGRGVVVLANLRLEEMFGYEHAELLGRPVESLVPSDLQAAHHGHRAAYTRAPRARPMGSGARLVALRKDGTTFPVEVSLSPVTSAAGKFALAMVRDVTGARRLEDFADLARTAAAAEQEHRARVLLDKIVTGLLHVGLNLQAAVDLPAEVTRQRIAEALGHLDDIIRGIRDTVFSARNHDPPP